VKDRILVVDDQRDVADSLVRLLRLLGYEARANSLNWEIGAEDRR
jgi:FixJ family two-component response regulator